jgi:putative endonuclease
MSSKPYQQSATAPARRPAPFRQRRAAHLRLGRRGERCACRALRELGLEILARNYRTGQGEIDIVARDEETLCFIEVKTRRRQTDARPAEAVGPAKRRRIVQAANRYLREIGHPPVVHRYDIVEVIVNGRRVDALRHWPGAFTEDERQPHVPFPDV